MLTQGEDVEAHALFGRGWTISAIARHLDRDRKTVRSYLAGETKPGVRRPSAPDVLAPFVAYLQARFADDCVPRTQGGSDVEGRSRRAVLCQRWREALRDRPAGGGPKPPQAAPVKSRGGERCRKRRAESPSGVSREGERERTNR